MECSLNILMIYSKNVQSAQKCAFHIISLEAPVKLPSVDLRRLLVGSENIHGKVCVYWVLRSVRISDLKLENVS